MSRISVVHCSEKSGQVLKRKLLDDEVQLARRDGCRSATIASKFIGLPRGGDSVGMGSRVYLVEARPNIAVL